jgi:hypothetical protein
MASESQMGLQEVLGPEETQQELWESVVIVRDSVVCNWRVIQ